MRHKSIIPSGRKVLLPLLLGLLIIGIKNILHLEMPFYYLSNDFYIQGYQATKDEEKQDTSIFIVNIRDFPTDVIKDQIEILSLYNPAVIAVDYFTEERMSKNDTSKILFDNLVLPIIKQNDRIKKPVNPFSESAHYGYSTIYSATYFEPFSEINNESIPCIGTKIIELFDSSLYSQLKKRNIDKEIINYSGNIYQFKYLGDLTKTSPKVLKNIAGNIVLVGYTGIDSPFPSDINCNDTHGTPRSLMYGVVMIANMVYTLKNHYISPFNKVLSFFIVIVLAIFNVLFPIFVLQYKASYIIIKIIQCLQYVILFTAASLVIYIFSISIDFESMALIMILVPELTFWYHKVLPKKANSHL